MKKKFIATLSLLAVLALTSCANTSSSSLSSEISSTSTQTSTTTSSSSTTSSATSEHTLDMITFTKDKNKPVYEKDPETGKIISNGRYAVTSENGRKDLKFFYKGAKENSNVFLDFDYNGTFGNGYLKNHPTHNKIKGLKSLLVKYSGGPLSVNYSFEEFMVNGNYRVMNQSLESGVPYTFDDTYPEYFNIATIFEGGTLIESIQITYTGNDEDKKIPTDTYYQPGYHVGPLHGREGLENAFTGSATNSEDAYNLISMAAVLHYEVAKITFNFNNTEEDPNYYLHQRDDLIHVYFYPLEYTPGMNNTNTFLIMYFGQTQYNNDVYFYKDADVDEVSLDYFINVASYTTPVTEENKADHLINANSYRRQHYYEVNNMLRDPNYNDFPIEKLDDTKEIPVYNSEELWWVVSQGYKPTFALENSKAEWIYNQAKDVLRRNVNDHMSKYQKIRAIYEWIIAHTAYDYDGVDNSSRQVTNHRCYYLEAVFENGGGVCDAFSKAFVLLGKMEGLDVLRGAGFPPKGGMGHAWNYARVDDGPYYLVDLTAGNAKRGLLEGNKLMTIYVPFMTSKNLFKDYHKMNVPDLLNQYKPLSDKILDPSVYALDSSLTDGNYNLEIKTEEDLAFAFNEVYPLLDGKEFTMTFRFFDKELRKRTKQVFLANGFDNVKYKLYGFENETYDVFSVTFAFIFR